MLGGRERRRSFDRSDNFVHNLRVQVAFDPAEVSRQLGDDFPDRQAQDLVTGDVRDVPEAGVPRLLDAVLEGRRLVR